MNKQWIAFAIAVFAVSNALAALNVGDKAPDFSATASLAGKPFDFSLKEQLRKGPVVVYFYPSAYTNGCNMQARAFADHRDKFVSAGATVVGVSLDSIARLNSFSADPEYCGGKVAVASDPDGSISRSFALSIREAEAGKKDTRGNEITHGRVERTSFVITPEGRIAATIGGIAPVENVLKALEVVQSLAEEKKRRAIR